MKKSLMTKVLVTALIVVAALGITACGSKDKSEGETLVAVTEPTFAPFDTTDEDGNIIGFDMDLLNAIAEDQGFTVEYKAVEFDSLIPSITAGNADIISAGMNAEDPERQKKVDFSMTYYDSGLVVMVKNDNTAITGIDSLPADAKVASQTGTTGADEVDALKADGKIGQSVILNEFTTAVLQLQNGDIDAIIIDKPVAENYVKKQDGLKIVGETLNAESYGFAVSKDNPELLKKINTGLQNLIDNGKFKEICDKWEIASKY